MRSQLLKRIISAPKAESRWHAYLYGYQRIPDEELLTIQDVVLDVSLAGILSKDGYRVNCDICGFVYALGGVSSP